MILLDTSFLIAYFNQRDENHQKAINLVKNIVDQKFGSLYTTDYIFNETVTVSLIRMKSLERAKSIGNILLKALEMIQIGEGVFLEAWKIFQSQKGTRFGFTGCTTIATMRHGGINNIATFDKDFTKIREINCIGL